MAYNNVNQATGTKLPGGAESTPAGATRDFQPGQPMSIAQGVPSADSSRSQHPSGAKGEEKLEREGHLPGLSEVQKDNEKDLRQPGQEDAAGNKIHHKGIFKKMLHWEHNGMNAD
ncbi:MAG: hypothetical protein Q9166_007875 [cf. Caloplaca sp. 2 TL-2023]